MKTILAATGNAHKVEEITAILKPLAIKVISFKDIDMELPEVVEDKDTFVGNATKKAVEIAEATGMVCLADDSGLIVDALNGEPGVYSARYAGEHASDLDNMNKLLKNLIGIENRTARFACCLAVATPTEVIGTAEGFVPGKIIDEPRGSHGFGYDPCFVPDGFDKTFAELGSEVKDSISHRGNALREAVKAGLFDI